MMGYDIITGTVQSCTWLKERNAKPTTLYYSSNTQQLFFHKKVNSLPLLLFPQTQATNAFIWSFHRSASTWPQVRKLTQNSEKPPIKRSENIWMMDQHGATTWMSILEAYFSLHFNVSERIFYILVILDEWFCILNKNKKITRWTNPYQNVRVVS